MTEYSGFGPVPGTTDEQQTAIDFAITIAPPSNADGLRRLIFAGLGGVARDFSDAEVSAAIVVALVNGSGVSIPSALFPAPDLLANTNQVLAAKAGASGNGSAGAAVSQLMVGKGTLGGSASVKAN
jgi:hypothetical protein